MKIANFTNAGRATVHMSDDEARTVYFSLRAYRDQLHKTLQTVLYKDLTEDDYSVDTVESGLMPDFTARVPQVTLQAMMDNNTDYEEFMFLFEQLSKVNACLFELTQNYDEEMSARVTRWLNV